MTGHQVWCSLHANDAASCLDRLRDMNVEPYKLTDPTLVTGLIGQRLVRRLNEKCRIGLDEAAARDVSAEVKLLGPNTRAEAERLRGLTGREVWFPDYALAEREDVQPYVGRTVVAEVMLPDVKFMDLVRAEQKAAAIASWKEATKGLTMIEHGIVKILLGEATPFEIEDKVGMLHEVSDDRVVELYQKYVKGGE
jgi:type II secretory ATPase GspE/PulE/Tfp pilus assembly ATPase PilB-like protein